MTICNMSIEAGAKAGLIAPDDVTFAYLEGRPHAPKGADVGAGAGRLAHAAHRRRRHLRQGGAPRRRRHRRRTCRGARTPPRSCRSPAAIPSPDDFADAERARQRGPRPRVHGPHGRHARARRRRRHGVHRVVHQLPHRGPAGRRRRRRGPPGEGGRPHPRRARLVRGEAPGRGRGPRQGVHGRRVRLAGAGLLDVPGHEPRQARPRRARRRPPATATSRAARAGAGAPTSSPPPSPPPPPSPGTSPCPPTWSEDHDAGRAHRPGHRGAARPLRRRHRPDHPGRVAQARRAHRLRQGPVLLVARRPRVRAQRRALRRRQHPRRRPQLRHRLVPGARRVGDHGLRLPGRGEPPLRRHLPQQLHEERARAGAGERRGGRAAAAPPSRPTPPSSSPSTSTAARSRRRPSASRSTSRSTTPPASASSRASTTSASPCAPRTPSPTFEALPPRLASGDGARQTASTRTRQGQLRGSQPARRTGRRAAGREIALGQGDEVGGGRRRRRGARSPRCGAARRRPRRRWPRAAPAASARRAGRPSR